MHRATADDYIRAASVATDIKPIELPLGHAALLFRFNAERRRAVAKLITDKTRREAARIVIAYADEEPAGRKSGKRSAEARDADLALLAEVVRMSSGLRVVSARRAIARLRPGDRARLARSLRALEVKLSKLTQTANR